MRHSDTEWLDVTTHFYFKYLESKGPTLGLDIFQEYFSPELPFMRHQAFPSPNNSLSTLDPFCTSKEGSVWKCNILLAKTSAGQERSKVQVQVQTSDSIQELESTLLRQAAEARSKRKGGTMSYKENLASSRVVSNRRVRNTCNKQLEATYTGCPLLLKRL